VPVKQVAQDPPQDPSWPLIILSVHKSPHD
jgi:hypothetical protein